MMQLPEFSNMVRVGQLRFIQSAYEQPEFRNPDTCVGDFLPTLRRWQCGFQGRLRLSALRSDPFYYYVLARTKYYDAVFLDAIRDQVDDIVNIGCGSDTRAYRFGHLLQRRGIRVLECDQPAAIAAKQELARRRWAAPHVEYLAIDLNDRAWPCFQEWLDGRRDARVLVVMEGVSPYIDETRFGQWLALLARELRAGSQVAYDCKLRGIADAFGSSARAPLPFRQSSAVDEVHAFHAVRGYALDHFELSGDLTTRLLPQLAATPASLFRQDALMRLTVTGAARVR